MGKHLTVEEKLRAEDEFAENILKIREITKQRQQLRYRNKRLLNYLLYSKRSKYKGLNPMYSTSYKMFQKKYGELSINERREYNKLKQREHRKK